jgi:GAF domain-containing protein
VWIDSTSADSRWPEFASAAAAHGLKSALSVPLVAGGDGLGALTVYCRRDHGFTSAGSPLAAALGSAASVALANARTYRRVTGLAEQLEQAIAARRALDQATGIIMARHGCSPAHALRLLTAAQRNRLTVAELAADLIERTSTPGGQAPEPAVATAEQHAATCSGPRTAPGRRSLGAAAEERRTCT